MRKIITYIRTNLIIIFSFLFLLEFAFLLWIKTTSLSEFGLNFFTELLGVVITVFLVDELIKIREERKNAGPKTLAYKNILNFTSKYIWFWREIYRGSVPKSEPNTINDFFTRDNFRLIWNCLNLEANVNSQAEAYIDKKISKYLFSGNYWEYIPNRIRKFSNQLDKIVTTYSNYLEPEILTAIIGIVESDFFYKLGKNLAIGRANFQDNENRPNHDTRPLLKNWSGVLLTKKDAKNILTLYEWCLDNRSKYQAALNEVDYINLEYDKPLQYIAEQIKPNLIKDFTGNEKRPVHIIFAEE